MVQKKMFEPKRYGLLGQMRKLHTSELSDMYYSFIQQVPQFWQRRH
jgi:hypothetical protein